MGEPEIGEVSRPDSDDVLVRDVELQVGSCGGQKKVGLGEIVGDLEGFRECGK